MGECVRCLHHTTRFQVLFSEAYSDCVCVRVCVQIFSLDGKCYRNIQIELDPEQQKNRMLSILHKWKHFMYDISMACEFLQKWVRFA